jgi:hypothetical protein
LIPGTKDKPHKVNRGAVQVDGMALEFNIDPADDAVEFETNVNNVLGTLKGMIAPNYTLAIQPVAEFGKALIEKQPEVARILGCEPDFNAYTKAPNPVPNAKQDFRTASGHIHISWRDPSNAKWPDKLDPFEPSHFEGCCQLVKTLDAFLGIPSLVWDQDTKRRMLYGKAGCFRPKSYGGGWHGLEYRVLSNKWLLYPQAQDLVFGNTVAAIEALLNDYDVADKKWYGNATAQQIIDGASNEKMKEYGARILEDKVIKSPAYYRELREQKVAKK